jgi:hypothetical protein
MMFSKSYLKYDTWILEREKKQDYNWKNRKFRGLKMKVIKYIQLEEKKLERLKMKVIYI